MTRLKRNFNTEEKAQTNIIQGVIVLGVVGIALGIMVMIFAVMEPTILESSGTTIYDAATSPADPATGGLTLNYTMIDATTMRVYNATQELSINSDFWAYEANNTVLFADPGVSDVEASVAYTVTYDGAGDGYTSVQGVNANVYKGFDLGSIAPLIMGATLVISIVLGMVGAFMYRKE